MKMSQLLSIFCKERFTHIFGGNCTFVANLACLTINMINAIDLLIAANSDYIDINTIDILNLSPCIINHYYYYYYYYYY